MTGRKNITDEEASHDVCRFDVPPVAFMPGHSR
jgi:hypothetical protein